MQQRTIIIIIIIIIYLFSYLFIYYVEAAKQHQNIKGRETIHKNNFKKQ